MPRDGKNMNDRLLKAWQSYAEEVVEAEAVLEKAANTYKAVLDGIIADCKHETSFEGAGARYCKDCGLLERGLLYGTQYEYFIFTGSYPPAYSDYYFFRPRKTVARILVGAKVEVRESYSEPRHPDNG